jgi:hypothetical protein
VLFRCPACIDLLTDSSPRICKPYFHLRSAVAPHIEPYYDEYAAPYVEAARPYYDTLNERVITPVTVLGEKYGAPRVAQAQAYGQAQWEKNLQPQVVKFQAIAAEQYHQHLAPHLEKAAVALGPYYDIASTNALQTYYEFLLPAYTTVQPYAVQGYDIASDFTVNTAIPYTQWALTTTGTFLERTVFPKLRILYGENVEPQLVRIGERLGRYRDGKKLQAIVDEIDRCLTPWCVGVQCANKVSSVLPPRLLYHPELRQQQLQHLPPVLKLLPRLRLLKRVPQHPQKLLPKLLLSLSRKYAKRQRRSWRTT